MNQKSVIAIMGIIVVILIGTIVYFATINKVSRPVATQQPVATVVNNDSGALKIYQNDKYGFDLNYPSNWSLENNYKSASEKGNVGIVGWDNEFVTFTSPSSNSINIGITTIIEGTDTGDIRTGRGDDTFIKKGLVVLNNTNAPFYFMLNQDNTVLSGWFNYNPNNVPEVFTIGKYKIHATFSFKADQKIDLVEKDSDFKTAIKILESLKFAKK